MSKKAIVLFIIYAYMPVCFINIFINKKPPAPTKRRKVISVLPLLFGKNIAALVFGYSK